MSKSEKRLARLLAGPTDFTWDELVACLSDFGFKCVTTGGSRVVFISAQGRKIFVHRPHPGNRVKRYALQLIVDSLVAYGFISRGEI